MKNLENFLKSVIQETAILMPYSIFQGRSILPISRVKFQIFGLKSKQDEKSDEIFEINDPKKPSCFIQFPKWNFEG